MQRWRGRLDGQQQEFLLQDGKFALKSMPVKQGRLHTVSLNTAKRPTLNVALFSSRLNRTYSKGLGFA